MSDAATIVAGNWKMNLGPRDATRFVESLELPERGSGTRVLLFPPSVSLPAVVAALERHGAQGVAAGAQNVHQEDSGAFTGEISAPMAREAGAEYVLVGHSERRHVFGEDDETARRKVEAVIRGRLTPVLCVGETLDERRAGRVEEVVLRQLDAVLLEGGVQEALVEGRARLHLAYEPVWAIGTGETATPDDASQAHGVLRARLGETLGEEIGDRTRILYGGSVKPGNAAELMAAPGVDGVLVGGASLDPRSFARIVAAAG